jgi:hypothetical protein
MSSFQNLTSLQINDWNNMDLAVKNNPIIVPTIISAGKGVKYNFAISSEVQNRVLIEKDQVVQPEVRTLEANVGNLFIVGQESFKYHAYTKHYTINENADLYDASKFNFAVSSSISVLNKAYELDSYKGDGLNNGLISGVITDLLTYTTGDELLQFILAKKNKFIADNNLRASDRVYAMIGGQVYNDLNLPCLNGNKLVGLALSEMGVEVIFTPSFLNAGNRVDFVDFAGLSVAYGIEPSVISPLSIIGQVGSMNRTAQLFTGYQSVAIYKGLNSVQSYVKV